MDINMNNLSSCVSPKLLGCLRVSLLFFAWAGRVDAQDPPLQSADPTPATSPSAALATDAGGMAALAALEQATVAAIEQAESSVVAISRVRRDRRPPEPLDPLKLGSPLVPTESPESPDFVPTMFGSGVVISADGYIVTCAHVLDDPQRNDYFVWLNKESYPARVVGTPAKVLASDPYSDLAILKIDADNLIPMQFADVGNLRKGQFVIALGNPEAIARDGQVSASWGIIANLKRIAPSQDNRTVVAKETIHQFGTLIQTDAKLNLGTSGGALVNLRGEMIGLTTSLAALSGYEQSAGFAIAVDELFQRVVEALKQGKLPEYGFLGIQPEDLLDYERERGLVGAKVVVVIPGLPGDQAGLRPEDIVIEVGQTPIMNRNDLFRELSQAAAGAELELRVQRFRPGTRVPEILTLTAELSKKYVASSRPSFAVNAAPAWRGMDVEYTTALSEESARAAAFLGRRGAPKLAVLAVTPDTLAWEAGVRPGYGILSVDGNAVSSPDEFYRAIEGRNGPVELGVVQPNGSGQSLIVAAP
jgi:serine protease Do